jgi:hypothetical protein
MLTHTDLSAFYKTNFSLVQHHKYSLEEVESLIPWEREVYINLLISYLKEERDKAKNTKRA